jgi:hypothetical protein
MADSPSTRVFTADIETLQVTPYTAPSTLGTPVSLEPIFRDMNLRLEVETEASVAARDIINYLGYSANRFKSRQWSAEVSAVVPLNDFSGATTAPNDRSMGWDWYKIALGGNNYAPIFRSLSIDFSAELMSARAAQDTVLHGGWLYSRVRSRSWNAELNGIVSGGLAADNPFDALMLLDPDGVITFSIENLVTTPTVTLAGTGSIGGGEYGFGGEEGTQTARIVGSGPLTIGGSKADTALQLLQLAFGVGGDPAGVHLLEMTRPGDSGNLLTGQAFISSARLELADGACTQSATFTGFGPLEAVAIP